MAHVNYLSRNPIKNVCVLREEYDECKTLQDFQKLDEFCKNIIDRPSDHGDYQIQNGLVVTKDNSPNYQTSNGIERNEEATYTNANGRGDHYVLTGFFSYRGPDGVDYKVKYTADKDGFHPEGDHFTVPPYTPWNIEYNENGEEIYSADFSNEGKIARLPKKLKEDTPEKAYLPAAENRRKRLI
ncbi:uncharacterized protein LOC112905552 [Agrilus planipennis]|uniref:Uncharacterized protein LOC112905552 n=1 Tax=Agrilus planipennis TaxID=224129 RepID=A0A7F5RDA3_AGRPL|nr:uncharacterized protein LOC112905552 [Agrilus planipennis]